MLGTLSIHPLWKPAPSQRLKVLIADDNRDTLSTLTTLLEDEGHDVLNVGRSADVLGAEREFKPDVVILDLQMPDISGYDLARWLRSRHPARCPLLIAISGAYTRPSDKMFSRIMGFHYYLTKPYAIEDLLFLIAQPAA